MLPGEYHVNYEDGTGATNYVTDTLADALEHGRAMAPPPPKLPPMGPTGRRSRKGDIYKHNRKYLARLFRHQKEEKK